MINSGLKFGNLYSSSSAANSMITRSLNKLKSNDEMEILSSLNSLMTELSIATDSIGENSKLNDLIRELVGLLDKFPDLPFIATSSLQCLNYIIDINPKLSNSIVNHGGTKMICNKLLNVENFETVEVAIKVLEKMSNENALSLLEAKCFINILQFVDFFDLNLRLTLLKCCLNITKGLNSYDQINKYINEGIPNLINLIKIEGTAELEKTICHLAIHNLFNILNCAKNFTKKHQKEIKALSKLIKDCRLVENLYNIFIQFFHAKENEKGQLKTNVGTETMNIILKLFESLCNIDDTVVDFLLDKGILDYIYKVLYNEISLIKDKNMNDTEKTEEESNDKGDMKINSNSQSLYKGIFGLLISLFPLIEQTNSDELLKFDSNNLRYSKTKILSENNQKFFLFFSDKILILLIENILHIPSTATTLGVIKLITMYISINEDNNIRKYIDENQLSNSVSKMLDSRDTSYIIEVFDLIELIMNKIPSKFIIPFIREGVIENIKKLNTIETKNLYIAKETDLSKAKIIVNRTVQFNANLFSSSLNLANQNANAITEFINIRSIDIMENYFKDSQIETIIHSFYDAQNNADFIDPLTIMKELNNYKNKFKDGKATIEDVQKTLDIILNKKVTFFELEKSEIIFYLVHYFDENYLTNYNNSVDNEKKTDVTLCGKYNEKIIIKLKEFFNLFKKESSNISLEKFLQILQQSISSMNCFKLYLYDYESNKKATLNLFASTFQDNLSFFNPKKLSLSMSFKDDIQVFPMIEKEFPLISKSLKFYLDNKKTRLPIDGEVTFQKIKSILLKYPLEDKKEESDDDIQEILKMLLQRDINAANKNKNKNENNSTNKKSESGNENNNDEDELSNPLLDSDLLNKFIQRRKERITNQVQNKNVNESDTKIDNKDINSNKELLERELEKFFKKFDIHFFVDNSIFCKLDILPEESVNQMLRDAKRNFTQDDFSSFCSDFNVSFRVGENQEKKENDVCSISSSLFDKFKSLPKEDLSDNQIEEILFQHFYYNFIVNNKALYVTKRASPFFFFICLVQLCNKNFNKLFNIQSPLDKKLFENLKMTSLLFKQVKDPFAVSYQSIPKWCRELAMSYQFLNNFSSRFLLFKTTSFDNKRNMGHLFSFLKNFMSENMSEKKSINPLANIKRTKIKVNRDKIINDAYSIVNKFPNYTGYIEFDYVNETGTGLGPTLEFYSLISQSVVDKKNIWYNTNDLTLFPIPTTGKTAEEIEEVKKIFSILGFFIARALYDDRLINLPLNQIFWDLVLKRPISYKSIEKIDPGLYNFIYNNESISFAKDLNESDLNFTLPWNQNIELLKGGSQLNLSIDNVEKYKALVFKKLLVDGQKEIIDSFISGFNKVFDISCIKILSSLELEEIICSNKSYDDETWSYENLIQNIIPTHGFDKESLMFNGLIEVLIGFNQEQRKKFLKFVTGCDRLPIGGFKNLNPKLTVVMFKSEILKGNVVIKEDEHLPSVMTCQNYLKIPNYSSVEILREKLLCAISEGSNAFLLT